MAEQEGSDFHVQENIPPGFRFMPTDKELLYYLNLKILNNRISTDAIKDVDLYKYHPSDLCQSEMNGTHEGYFFTSRTRKYQKGSRPDRTAADGYWKATGGDIILHSNGLEVGRKKVLVYYERKSDNNNKGTKTDWIMHEYTIHQMKDVACSSTNAIPEDKMLDKSVCRIYNRTSKSSKNKEQDTQRNMIPIQGTYVPDVNLSATSSYHNPVPALDQTSLQGAYLPEQQARINDQYHLVPEPVTYMHGDMAIQSNILTSPELTYFRGDHILPSAQPLANIPGDQTNVTLYNPLITPETGSNDQYQRITHMNGDVGTSRFAASTSNDDGIYLDFTTPYFSPRFDLSPPMDPNILDSLLGDSSNAQLQSSPIPPGQSIEQLDLDNILPQLDLPSPPIEWRDLDITLPQLDLPSPPLEWRDFDNTLLQLDHWALDFPLDDSSNMQFQSENVHGTGLSKFDSEVAESTLEDRI